MTLELYALTLVSTFTGLLWVPYIVNRITVGPGLLHEVGYPEDETSLSPWAARLKKAHLNAIENLVVFGVLVLVAQAAGVHSDLTEGSAVLYVICRVVHAAAYTMAVPWIRTLAFTGGWACQMVFAAALLTA